MSCRSPAGIVALALLLTTVACSSRFVAPDTTAPRPEAALRFVYAEQDGGVTTLWSARPEEPSERRRLARLPHDPAWGIRAALSPDGRHLAATVMPAGARDPDRDAVLILLDLTDRTSRRLAVGLDLRTTPLWSRDGAALVVQRAGRDRRGALLQVGLHGHERELRTADRGRRLVPLALTSADGPLYFADLGSDGVRVQMRGGSGSETVVAELGQGPARGFTLSHDGDALAFLRLDASDGKDRYRAHLADLRTGEVHPLRGETPRLEDTAVVWTEAGTLLTAVSAANGGGILLGATPASDQVREDGFDAAALASPDGRWLAVRAFSGADTRQPGAESLQLLHRDGRRLTVGVGVTVGWRQE